MNVSHMSAEVIDVDILVTERTTSIHKNYKEDKKIRKKVRKKSFRNEEDED